MRPCFDSCCNINYGTSMCLWFSFPVHFLFTLSIACCFSASVLCSALNFPFSFWALFPCTFSSLLGYFTSLSSWMTLPVSHLFIFPCAFSVCLPLGFAGSLCRASCEPFSILIFVFLTGYWISTFRHKKKAWHVKCSLKKDYSYLEAI